MVELNFDEERIKFTPIILFIDYINLLQNDFLKQNYKNITPRDYTYLVNILYNPNCSQKELAKLLFVSESNVAQIIKRLEKNGFIKRTPDVNNKSRKILTLTDDGKNIIFKILKDIYEWEADFLRDYEDEDIEKFKNMLYAYSQKTVNSI